jgi:hypothetical protein
MQQLVLELWASGSMKKTCKKNAQNYDLLDFLADRRAGSGFVFFPPTS